METKTLEKKELETSLSCVLTSGKDHHLKVFNHLGHFECKVENHGALVSVERNFQNQHEELIIPFMCERSNVQMIFSFSGQSVFRDRYNPYILPAARHSLNFFNPFDCRNLIGEKGRQFDMTFSLGESFYKHLLTDQYASTGNKLLENILNGKDFNTLDRHQQIDAGISGILQSILHCPYKDDVRTMYIQEHVRALLILQLCQFHHAVTGKVFPADQKITSRDKDTLYAIREHLDRNFLSPATLTDLSRHFGINEFKLKYGFKKLFDTSPIRYIQHKRLEFGALLLRETERTVDEIADEIGYNHANNFSLAFRKVFGHSPQYYRRKASAGNALHSCV